MLFMATRSTLSTLLLVLCQSSQGDDVGVPERAAGDYLHLSCRINSTSEDEEDDDDEEEDGGQRVQAPLRGQLKSMNRVMSSPNYPRNYPNRSECLEIITAPRGHRIRLDFGDDFHLESSNDCNFDYVELRDGPFGYSSLLGRFCGSQRPPVTESTGRYLWMRFQSDEYIEYKGFRAFYEFFEMDSEGKNRTTSDSLGIDLGVSDEEVCRIKVDTSRHEGIISHLDIAAAVLDRSNQSASPIDCTWLVYSPPTNRVYLRWSAYQMPPNPHVCQDSYLSVYERTTADSDKRREFCGAIARDLQLTSNRVYLRMFSKTRSLMPSFRIIITLFKHGPCPSWLFHCGDNTCINKSLVCNDQVNCNYSLDEAICRPTTETSSSTSVPLSTSVQTLAVAMVTGAIVTIVVVVCLVACRQRHRERRLRRHALKQEARHAEGADLLRPLGPFDGPTHINPCSVDGASRGSSDHHDPMTQPNDSEFQLVTKDLATNFESGGFEELHGPNSEPLRGPDFHWLPLTDSRSSNLQGVKWESSIYKKATHRPVTTAPHDNRVVKPWPSDRDGLPRFPSEISPFITDNITERSISHGYTITTDDPSNTDEATEVRWGQMGSRTLPLSRFCDSLQDSLPRTTSGPDVIVGNRSEDDARKWSQTGMKSDRDAILEPITVAGETTFPVYSEVVSATRHLRESPPPGTHFKPCREPGTKCDPGVVHTNTSFISDASGESVSMVGHMVSKRYHGDEVGGSGSDLRMTPTGNRRPNESERLDRVLCRKDDRTRKSGK